MSQINVNFIVNKNEDGPVELTNGAIIPSQNTINLNGNLSVTGVLTSTNYKLQNVSCSGVITATSFIGDGSGLSNLPPPTTPSKIIALKYLLSDPHFRS